MSHPNTDRDERVRQIRERHDYNRLWCKQNHMRTPGYSDDVEYLLSLLDSQAGCRDAEVVARQISDNVNQYPITSESVYEWQCMIADALTSAQESATTRMRDRCVEKVKELHDEYDRGETGERQLMIRIQLTADRSKEEAERLLREGGELHSMDVAKQLFDLLGGYETTRKDVTFWRISRDGTTREFNAKTMCAAIGQNMEFRPDSQAYVEDSVESERA